MALRGVLGMIKDKVSQSRAALLSKPNSTLISPRLAVLRATTHDPCSPPHEKHLETLLSSGDGSRATASALVEALMDRLQSTSNAAVALKCLVVAHHIANRGGFILQDQLSVFPAAGGRNYLKLSAFRDGASSSAWYLSSWVRWYAAYLEHHLASSRTLGFFISSSSSPPPRNFSKREERVIATFNPDLIVEIDSLVSLIGEIQKAPNESSSPSLRVNSLVEEIVALVGGDYLSAVSELSLRVNEFKNRLRWLSFGESVDLVCTLKKLEDCKEKLCILYPEKKGLTEGFWGLIREVREEVAKVTVKPDKDGRRLRRASESDRFGERVRLSSGNEGRYSSGRWELNRHRFPKLEQVKSTVW